MTKEKRDIFERLTTEIGCREISDLKFLTAASAAGFIILQFHKYVNKLSRIYPENLFGFRPLRGIFANSGIRMDAECKR